MKRERGKEKRQGKWQKENEKEEERAKESKGRRLGERGKRISRARAILSKIGTGMVSGGWKRQRSK